MKFKAKLLRRNFFVCMVYNKCISLVNSEIESYYCTVWNIIDTISSATIECSKQNSRLTGSYLSVPISLSLFIKYRYMYVCTYILKGIKTSTFLFMIIILDTYRKTNIH